MKKIIVLLFVAVATLWAKTKIEMIVRIVNLPEEVFDFDSWDENPDVCVNFGCWGENFFCPSILDSNILYGWAYIGSDIEFYVLTDAVHSWRETFEDELNRYRKCWKGVADDSSYNSIFTRIDSVLIPAINECKEGKSDCALVYDHSQARMLGLIVGSPIFEFHNFAIDTVKARNAAISSIAPVKYKLETIRVQNHRLIVAPKMLGLQFTLFDVNGHELRRGTLKNNMQLPAYPIVIKIQGFGTQLLK